MNNNSLENQLYKATSIMKKGPLFKLLNPGLHKFIMRYTERKKSRGSTKKCKLFYDQDMFVVLPEVISECIYTYGFFDEVVSFLVINNVKEGDVVLDIGAHYGYFSLLLSHIVGDEGKVFSFEPTPSTYEILLKNVNSRQNVIPVNKAVGSQNGEGEIIDYGLKYSGWNTLSLTESKAPHIFENCELNQVEVDVVKLDDYLLVDKVNPNFIKIDVESLEFDVISGLQDTIKMYGPKIIMETGSTSSLKAANLLLSYGYGAFVSKGFGSVIRLEDDIEIANKIYKDILFVMDISDR